MEITTERLENCELKLTVTLDGERTQKAMQRAARSISEQVKIDGFRQGKAPYELIVQRYGEDTVRKEAAEMLVDEVYREATKQEGVVPFAPAVLRQAALDPITFEFTVPLAPIVDVGDYRGYRLKPPKVKVGKKEVQEAIERIRRQNALLETVDRPVQMGDGVDVDVVGRTADGTEFIRQDKVRVMVEADSDGLVPHLVEAVVGMRTGEERTFTETIPPDFDREKLRGQEASFTVTLNEVYESTLPEMDDDLARTVGSFGSFKELKEFVTAQLEEAAQQEADAKYALEVIEAITGQAQVEFPLLLLEQTLDDMVKERERTVKRQAHLPLEDYLRSQGTTIEQLREEWRPTAANEVKRSLVLSEIVRLEELDVAGEEINAQIEVMSAPWGVRAEEMRASFSSDAGLRAVRNRLLGNKAVQRLVAIAKGEAPPKSS